MARSFFHLTEHQDHVCITRREPATLEHQDFIESLSPAELTALQEQSAALANVLYRAINGYCRKHPETSYGAIVEALDFVGCRIDLEMQDDLPDPEDCDA